jgi:hypothetical protein
MLSARILFILNLLIAASLVTTASILTAKGGALEGCFAIGRTELA